MHRFYTFLFNFTQNLTYFLLKYTRSYRLQEHLHNLSDYLYGQWVLHNETCYCPDCTGERHAGGWNGDSPDHRSGDAEYVSYTDYCKRAASSSADLLNRPGF